MKVVDVIPLKKGLLRSNLSYFSLKNIEIGDIVTINLRNKKTLGLVVSSEDITDTKMNIKDMDFNLKKILEVKEKTLFLKEYIEAVMLVSDYFVCGKSMAMTSLTPSVFREEYDIIAKFENLSLKNHKSPSSTPREKLILQETLENRISIYKTLIRENFAKKQSVFIVLPTEKDIELFEEQLSRGIEQFTVAIYANNSPKKIIEKYKKIITSEHPILILGTAPFLSIPRADLGVVVLEHESSSSYRTISRPYIDLRVFVEIFAAKINAKFIISDNLLRFETIHRKETNELNPMHPLLFRLNFNNEIIVDDKKNNIDNVDSGTRQPFRIFSDNSLNIINETIANKKNVFVFSLRKGLATETICGDCASVITCDKCMAPLVLYKSNSGKKRMFVCNKCEEEKDSNITCPNCNSWNLVPLGIGTDTVFDELSNIFPQAKIFKFDKESIKNKASAKKIMEEFEKTQGGILVGTEMALHYMKNKVELSIIASFDSFWSIPNFRISERIIGLAVSIIAKTKNDFIIQTKNKKDSAILAIKSRNLMAFIREELLDRKNLGYPPFKRFIKIKYVGNKPDAIKAKEFLEDSLKEYSPLIFGGSVAKQADKYTTNALVKVDPNKWYVPEMLTGSHIDKKLSEKLTLLPHSFYISVDPEDLL